MNSEAMLTVAKLYINKSLDWGAAETHWMKSSQWSFSIDDQCGTVDVHFMQITLPLYIQATLFI